MRIISLANQKGGTGKTTAAVNIAAMLAKKNKRTLLVDLDPQANATMSLIDPLDVNSENSIGPLLMGDIKFEDAIYTCKSLSKLHIIPATLDLSITELDLTRLPTGGVLLERRLKNVDSFDYVICDCPPNFGVLTSNGLTASTHMIVPMEPETFAIYGLQMLMTNIVPKILKLINPDLRLLGILLCKVNPVRNLTANIRLELRRLYNELLFETEIPIDVRLPESQAVHRPVVMYQSWSRAAKAYERLTAEILDRFGDE